MVLENFFLDGGIRYEIPDLPNSYLELGPDVTTGGTLLSFNLSIEDILEGRIDTQSILGLPGGRNIPGVESGRLPATAFTVRDEEGNSIFRRITFYLGNSYFGLFLPLQFAEGVQLPGGLLTTRYFIGDKRAGTISLVSPDKNGENGGVFLLLNLATTKSTLKKMLAQPKKRLLWDNI
jgi:hypothetical protein